ncbi:MAG: glutathione S-transferase, partial [Pseudomonadota bacterium]
MTATLHCFAQSGNAYKAALMLELCGQPWEPIQVDFFNGAARTPEYAALNEMAEVPTYTEGDLCLTQSGVIL